MSRAEKFIEEYTKNCSNEILSPYPQIIDDVRRIDGEPAKEFSPWLTPDQARRAVEIAREEIIEKVYEYLELKIWAMNMGDQKFTDECIEDLKQAMKDE